VILYLHGFRSSPRSTKAQQIRECLARRAPHAPRYECPQLPASPRAAAALLADVAGAVDPGSLALIGSSLGGYYATWLAERVGCRAVLLNPAVRPYDDLQAHLGRQQVFHGGGEFEFRAAYLDELRALDTPVITRPERYFLVAATGDEVIDYRTMVTKYAGCAQCVIDGSDHALTDFENHIDRVLAFCGA